MRNTLGEYAIYVEEGNIESITSGLIQAFGDCNEDKILKEASERIKSNFSFDSKIKQLRHHIKF